MAGNIFDPNRFRSDSGSTEGSKPSADSYSSASSTDDNQQSFSPRDYDDDQAKITFRLKSAAGCGALLLVFMALCSSFGGSHRSSPGGLAGSNSNRSHHASHRSSKRDQPEFAEAEEEDVEEALGNRSIEKARAEEGFFHRLICRGGYQPTFCK